MKITKIKLPFEYFHFIVITLLLFLLTIQNIYYLIPSIIYIFFIHKNKEVLKYSLIIVMLSFSIIVLTPKTIVKDEFYGTVLQIEEKTRTNQLVIKVNNSKVIAYLDKDIDINVGDRGYFECSKSISNNTNYNGNFNYDEYLYNSYIEGVYFVNTYQYIKNTFVISSVQYNIKEYFEDVLNNEALKYSLMLIIGYDSFSKEESQVVKDLGIMHLFCISGMHINFILIVVSFILSKLKINDDVSGVIQVIFVTVLLIITNFQISVIRAFLMFMIPFICKKKNIRISSLDSLCLSAIILLLFRPRYINLVGFQLTYLVTFFLIITSDIYKNKSSLYTLSLQSVIAFASTFPIIVNINYEINLLTIFNSTFISIPFSYVIMPLTFISAIFRLEFFNPLFKLFDYLLYDLSKLDMFIIRISKLNFLSICIYYLLVFLILKAIYIKKHLYKMCAILVSFIFIIIASSRLNNVTTVTFFSVGQGDSALISLAYNKGNILIDCFGGVSDLIKTRGIKKLDYVIITHAHYDHYGDLSIVLEEFDVGKTIGSYYDQDSKELNLDLYLAAGDKIYIDNIILDFIAPSASHSDINRASLVFKTTILNYTFLFTGDTTKEIEMTLLDKNIKSDVLKVPHHGSSTSSCIEFVNAVDPKYSIFSYGLSNSYGLPNYDVISRYSSINYHTPIDGSIEFYYTSEWRVRLFNDKPVGLGIL